MQRHELDPVSLTFGFAFSGIGLLFLLGHPEQALRLRWVWPLLLLALGAGILLDIARHHGDAAPDPTPSASRGAADPAPDPDLPTEELPDPDLESGRAADERERPTQS